MDKEIVVKTIEYFLKMVRWGLCEELQSLPAPEKPEGVSWGILFKIARSQSLVPLSWKCIENLKNKPPEELYNKWRGKYENCVIVDFNQSFAWEEIQKTFEEKQIRILPLKGLNVKKIYPETHLRTMGDLDILYDFENFDKMRSVLEELGYVFQEKTINEKHQVFDRYPHVELEMHKALLEKTSKYYGFYNEVWRRAIPTDKPYLYRFSHEDEYIFMMIHNHGHFSYAGCGARIVIDYYLFMKAYKDVLDWNYINEQLEYAESIAAKHGWKHKPLIQFEKDVKKQVENWFSQDDIIIDDMSIKLLSGTVYGSVDNAVARESERQGTFKYIWNRFFPSFSWLKERYPVLEKWPILMPFCWIARLFTAIFKNNKQLKKEFGSIKKGREEKQKIDELNKKA